MLVGAVYEDPAATGGVTGAGSSCAAAASCRLSGHRRGRSRASRSLRRIPADVVPVLIVTLPPAVAARRRHSIGSVCAFLAGATASITRRLMYSPRTSGSSGRRRAAAVTVRWIPTQAQPRRPCQSKGLRFTASWTSRRASIEARPPSSNVVAVMLGTVAAGLFVSPVARRSATIGGLERSSLAWSTVCAGQQESKERFEPELPQAPHQAPGSSWKKLVAYVPTRSCRTATTCRLGAAPRQLRANCTCLLLRNSELTELPTVSGILIMAAGHPNMDAFSVELGALDA